MTFIRYAATALVGLAVATSALAITPMPSPMPTKEVITIGYVKVGQVTPPPRGGACAPRCAAPPGSGPVQ